MTRIRRIRSEALATGRSFLRRRTAVFFTFFFPAILIVIFGGLVSTGAGETGLFARPAGYYVAGYLAVVVLFTPLSRLGATVARDRTEHRFEKLATTPLSRSEWLLAHAFLNAVVVGVASLLILGLTVWLTGARVSPSPLLGPFVAGGVVLFCGVGAIIGSVASSQDGAVTAANAIGLPILFLSETFVPPAMLPEWFEPVVALSPLTYFASGVRAAIYPPSTGSPVGPLLVLLVLATVSFVLGVWSLPFGE